MNEDTIYDGVTIAPGIVSKTMIAGRYRVVRKLGEGGMGSIWLAEDTKLDDRLVAIKMLPSILVANPRAYVQVKKEALVSLRLSHPNIATVRAFEEDNGNPFLVMDYIDGRTLDSVLAEKGTLTEDEAIRLLKPVADALDYAHAQGVVHRDVKPGNVMIDKSGRPYVLDFGIAREVQETMTRVTGKLSSGTLMYMSPEQLNGDAPTAAQDVYSFAAMAYECLKGEPPFSRGGIEDQIKHKPPAPLDPHIAISGSLMAGLAKTPERRPASCMDVIKPPIPRTPVRQVPSSVPARHASVDTAKVVRKSNAPLVVFLIAIAAVLAVSVGGWVLKMQKDTDAMRRELRALRSAGGLPKDGGWSGSDDGYQPEREAERIAAKVASMMTAFDQSRFSEIVGDPEAEKIPELRYLAGLVYENCLGGVTPDIKRAVTLYGGKKGVCALAEVRLAEMYLAGEYFNRDDSAATTNRILRCLPEIRRRADRGESLAAMQMYDFCESGIGVRRDRAAAKEWLDKAVESGNVISKFVQACRQCEGDRLYPKNLDSAMEILREIEPAGLWSVFFFRGMLEFGDGRQEQAKRDFSRALPTVTALAKQGLSEAQMALGIAYQVGLGVVQDSNQSIRWIREAASKGNATAQKLLGDCYYGGSGVNMDIREAMKLYRQAAENGNKEAMTVLAVAYSVGQGVELDRQEAARWARRSADLDCAQGQILLASFYLAGVGVEKDVESYLFWLKKGAGNGSVEGMKILGDCYRQGKSVRADFRQSAHWYRQAAERDNADAQNMLGYMYYRGDGVEKNLAEAFNWFTKAAEKGCSDAENSLGVMYMNGIGVEKDPIAAKIWLERAIEHGAVTAPFNLGCLYENGGLGSVNLSEARRLYRMAKSRGCKEAERKLKELGE